MKHCLVTGASGFVGRHLCGILAQQPEWQLRMACRNASRAPQLPTAQWCQQPDLNARADWAAALDGIHTLVHTAAQVHTRATDAGTWHHANTAATLALAQQAVATGVKRMVFISTVGVHGATSQAPLVETSALAPHTPYAESKLQAEQGLFALHRRGALEVVVVRPPMVYGPQAPGNFMRLARLLDQGWPLPFAQVRNQRSLVGIDNLVHFMALCMQHPRAAGEAFLVSDGEDVSTPQLITGMARALGLAPHLWPMPPALLRIGAQCTGQKALWQQLCGTLQINTDKARSLLGWQAPCTLEQGLHKALASPHTP